MAKKNTSRKYNKKNDPMDNMEKTIMTVLAVLIAVAIAGLRMQRFGFM